MTAALEDVSDALDDFAEACVTFSTTANHPERALVEIAVEKVIAEAVAEERARVNTPQTVDFMAAVPMEAEHQRQRWGSAHDGGKEPQDWFWLLGYLSGKALRSAISGDVEKAKHHTISSAAVLLNWHAHLTGSDTAMRPGIEAPRALRQGETKP